MKKKRTLTILIVLGLIFCLTPQSSSGSRLWKWTDESGAINFADDLSKVPLRFRDKAKGRTVSSPPPTSPAKEPAKGGNPQESGARQGEEEAKGPARKKSPPDLTVVKELADHLAGEVGRDEHIVKTVNNKIAFFKLRGLLQRDLPAKRKLLETLRKIEGLKMDKEIKWLSENIAMETMILETWLSGQYTTRKSRLLMRVRGRIRDALPGKKGMIQDLGKINP